MTYSLIALDIDGTIRSPEYPISGRPLEAITRARSTGAGVTVATGRIFQSARKACADLDLKDPIMQSNDVDVIGNINVEAGWECTSCQACTEACPVGNEVEKSDEIRN